MKPIYAGWSHIITYTKLHLSLQLKAFVCVFPCDIRRMFPVSLSTNSPVRSWTRFDPALTQSIPGSIPSVIGLVLLASDWPGLPSAGAARGCRVAFVLQPTWGSLLLWPRRRRWTAPLVGCSTGSPGHPGSKDHYSVPESVPWTAEGKEDEI